MTVVLTEEEFADDLVERIAVRVAEIMSERAADGADRWLDTRAAARHLGMTQNALDKVVRRGEGPPVHADGPGAKRWFRRSECDAWRAGG